MPSIWDHDLWQEIYDVQDPISKNVFVNLYRLILDMREGDVLAQKVADRINKRDRLVLTWTQKIIGTGMSILVAVDTYFHIKG